MKIIGKLALSVAVATFFVACGGGSSSTDSTGPADNSTDTTTQKVFKLSEDMLNDQNVDAGTFGVEFFADGKKFKMKHQGMDIKGTWSITGDSGVTLNVEEPADFAGPMPVEFEDVNKNGKLDEGDTIKTSHSSEAKAIKSMKPVEQSGSSAQSGDKANPFELTKEMLSGHTITGQKMVLKFVDDSKHELKVLAMSRTFKGTWSLKDKYTVVLKLEGFTEDNPVEIKNGLNAGALVKYTINSGMGGSEIEDTIVSFQ